MNGEKSELNDDRTHGRCNRFDYLEMKCPRIPPDKTVTGSLNDVIPFDLECVYCMINLAHSEFSDRLYEIELKLGIEKEKDY